MSTSSLGTGNPDRLSRIIWFLLILSFHLNGWQQILSWVWVSLTLDKLGVTWHPDRSNESPFLCVKLNIFVQFKEYV